MESRYEAAGEGPQYNAPHGTINVNVAPGSPRVGLFTVNEAPELIGRQEEVEELVTRIGAARASGRPVVVSAVSGMAGVGKTALARAAAARLVNSFPDARLEVDLLGFTPGEAPRTADDVLTELLSLAGFTQIPVGEAAKSRLWKAWLAQRSVLLVLDSARSHEQIGPLCPAATSRGSVVLITSRNTLSELTGTLRLALDLLSLPAAVDMLLRGAGLSAGQAPAGPWEELAEACGRLPLVLRPISHLLQDDDPHTLLEVLREHQNTFTGLPDIDQRTRAAFEVSYTALSGALQEFLLACALHPGPDFDARSLSAMTVTSIPAARLRLSDLHRHGMIIREAGGRFTMHDVFLTYARDRTRHDPEATQTARDSLYRMLTSTTRAATAVLTRTSPDDTSLIAPDRARPWLTAATNELRAASHAALTDQSPHARDLLTVVCWWLVLTDRHDQATALYGQARDLYEQTGDRRGQGYALLGLGETARMCSDYQRAEEFYGQARVLYEQIGSRLGQADALRGLGDTARMCSDYQRAEEFYGQARALYEQTGNRLGQADALRGLGDTARMCSDYQRAEEFQVQAHALYEQIADRLGQATALHGLGETARMRGDYQRAEEFYGQARALYEQTGNRLGLANALQGLGETARMCSDYQRAEEFQVQAHALYEQIADRLGQANALQGLGETARMRDDYQRAEEFQVQAHALYEQTGNRLGQGYALLGLGDTARMCGDYQRAEEFYGQARALYEQIADRLGQANALQGLGDTARMCSDYQRAEEFYGQARALYEQIADRLGQANALQGLGDTARMCGDYQRAEEFYGQARALYEQTGNRLGQANVVLRSARLAEAQGERQSAADLYAVAAHKYGDIQLSDRAAHCERKSSTLRSDEGTKTG
ncbi:tetratricopeptide repeat protein [Actinomadura luteofluorescens]|uniref:tetratricopeptide repeat protein n=1 Tax=Actinomadura luteofluorescens TaxID=46163 RepID=UPI003D9084F3